MELFHLGCLLLLAAGMTAGKSLDGYMKDVFDEAKRAAEELGSPGQLRGHTVNFLCEEESEEGCLKKKEKSDTRVFVALAMPDNKQPQKKGVEMQTMFSASNIELLSSNHHLASMLEEGSNSGSFSYSAFKAIESGKLSLKIFFTIGCTERGSSATPFEVKCGFSHERKCVFQIDETYRKQLIGFISLNLRKESQIDDRYVEEFLKRTTGKAVAPMSADDKDVQSRRTSSTRSAATNSTSSNSTVPSNSSNLHQIWLKATLIGTNLGSVIPYWYQYQLDDTTSPVDSIIDGGHDMFDRGNQVKFFEDDVEPSTYMEYLSTEQFKNYETAAGGGGAPFTTLAWISNSDGESHDYTMKVEGNLGADGDGSIVEYSGEVSVSSTETLEMTATYHTFQVVDGERPTVCEVYFTITYEGWESVAGTNFVATFSDETDEVSNSVVLSGSPQNVVFGYTLLSSTNHTVYPMIPENNITALLTDFLHLLVADDIVDNSQSDGGVFILTDTNTEITFSSPGYPTHINPESYFLYQVQAPNNTYVELTIDYDLQDASYYYLQLVNENGYHTIQPNANPIVYLLKEDSFRLTFRSWTYYNYGYQNYQSFSSKRGFSATIRLITPTSVNGATGAAFTSPGYPAANTDASYYISVFNTTSNALYKLTFDEIKINGENNYLAISDGYGTSYYYGNVETSNEVLYFIGGKSLILGYRSESAAAEEGFTGSFTEVTCKGNFTLDATTTETIEDRFPYLNDYWSLQRSCSFDFLAEDEYNVEVSIEFEKNESSQWNYHYFELQTVYDSYYRSISSLQSHATVVSSGNSLQISYSGYFPGNIKMTFRQTQINCGNVITVSSSETTNGSVTTVSPTTEPMDEAVGEIQSPSYPIVNTDVEDCWWTIEWNGLPIQFVLNSFTVTAGDGYLEVFDGYSRLQRFEESVTNPTKLISLSGYLSLRYHAPANSGVEGFHGEYGAASCSNTFSLTGTSAETMNVNQEPQSAYSHQNLRCEQTFIAETGYKAEVLVDFAASIYGSFGNVQVTNGNKTVYLYNYYSQNYAFVSSDTSITVSYDYSSYYNYGSSTGFEITYAQIVDTNCYSKIAATSSPSNISSSNFPGNYEDNEDCSWYITAEEGYTVLLTIKELTTDSEQDYLEITNDEGQKVTFYGTLDESVNLSSSKGGSIFVRFTTDGSGNQKGFQATYQQVHCSKAFHIGASNTQGIFGFFHTFLPENDYFHTNHSQTGTCEYFLNAEPGNALVVRLYNLNPDSCCWDFEVYDGEQYIGIYNGENTVATYVSLGGSIRLVYNNNDTDSSSYYYRQSFVSAYQVEGQCGGVLVAESERKTITSPSYPGSNPAGAACSWLISAPPGNNIRFTVEFLDLPDFLYLEISDESKGETRYTGLIDTPITSVFDSSPIRVQFFALPFFNYRKGFTAYFSLEENACSSNPCMNDGICITEGDSFSCICPEFYTGDTCEAFLSPCDSSPCLNGGTCSFNATNNGYSCQCPENFRGDLCHGIENECERNNSCAAHATCKDLDVGFNCTCDAGYRGNGFDKCFEIILLPYGTDVGDTLLPVEDDADSYDHWLDYAIPFGTQSFSNFRVTTNGLISLGWWYYWKDNLHHPPANGFEGFVALIAPFWDDFHPSPNNNGRVYYQVYDKTEQTNDSNGIALFSEITKRIQDKYGVIFSPTFVLKATWHEVVMYPEYFPGHRDYPSTFQAVLTSDGCDTYLIYLYKEDAMLWKTGIRSTDRGLIGFTNGKELVYVERQGNESYRPDKRVQNTDGVTNGQYFYKLTESKTPAQEARCGCVRWYLEDLESNWTPNWNPCPCTNFQASEDPRFTRSVDFNLKRNALNGTKNTADITEWTYDSVPTGQCYQLRNGTGPRCCYYQRRFSSNNWWWGWWWFNGALVWGPFGSHYERFQIPIEDENGLVDDRNQATFLEQYNATLYGDLIPRRQCCLESNSWQYCRMFWQRRPTATCWGYVWRGRVFMWGDPHFTTTDDASYTFNGLGEFYLVYAPGIFTLQGRTQRVEKEDGTTSDATGFVSFAAQNHNPTSGNVQFDVDLSDDSGSGILVKVNDETVGGLSEDEVSISGVVLKVVNGSYTAIFASRHSVTVSASSFLLTVQFSGDPDVLRGVSKGLLGYWSGDMEDDFQLRNGTTLNYESLKVTNDPDILNGTLSEAMLYDFGLSWQVPEDESLFTYTGVGDDTYVGHNPSAPAQPPFLEELVGAQRGSATFDDYLENCTTDGVVSTTCLYDTLTTDKKSIGQATLNIGSAFARSSVIRSNTPPTITVADGSSSFVDDYFQVTVGSESMLTLTATDVDGDTITFSLADTNNLTGPAVDSTSGVVTWTPQSTDLALDATTTSLVIQADDGNGGESLITLQIKLCPCPSNGECQFSEAGSGSLFYQTINCLCESAWDGDDCTEDRNGCLISPCYTGVECTDVVAPGVGADCGPCPDGTAGNGTVCITVNLCDSSPCQHTCSPIFNGYDCSCNTGYSVVADNTDLCEDINECTAGDDPCAKYTGSVCINNNGSYSCQCPAGYQININTCEDMDECSMNTHDCDEKTSACSNLNGNYTCRCRSGYERADGNDSCTNIDECRSADLNDCHAEATCADTEGAFTCTCQEGYEGDGKNCEKMATTTEGSSAQSVSKLNGVVLMIVAATASVLAGSTL